MLYSKSSCIVCGGPFLTLSYPWDVMQVLGAHLDRVGSKPFAVYTIRVKDTEDRTWRIQRRYCMVQVLIEFIVQFQKLQCFYVNNYEVQSVDSGQKYDGLSCVSALKLTSKSKRIT